MNRRKRISKELIPFEKSKRVIHVEDRGRKSAKVSAHPVMAFAFALFGVLCLLYCVGIRFAGFGSPFFLMWGIIGLVSIILAIALANRRILNKIPKWLKVTFWGAFGAGMILFCVIEGMICTEFGANPSPGADYCVVLGAQWKTTGPSAVLKMRLDAAIEYLNENPDTLVIVSGGQGGNEIMTEAAGMQSYMIDAGIDKSRIIMEDASTNTYENLIFSAEFLDKQRDKVVIVTNNFHTFRALCIARKQGYENLEGLSADSTPAYLPNNMLREFVGIIKDFVFGNL